MNRACIFRAFPALLATISATLSSPLASQVRPTDHRGVELCLVVSDQRVFSIDVVEARRASLRLPPNLQALIEDPCGKRLQVAEELATELSLFPSVESAAARGGEVLLTLAPAATPEAAEDQFYGELHGRHFASATIPAGSNAARKVFTLKPDIRLSAVPLQAPHVGPPTEGFQDLADTPRVDTDRHATHAHDQRVYTTERRAGARPGECETVGPPIPRDPQFCNQDGLEISDFPEAWTLQEGMGHVTVAVIDSGLDIRQRDVDRASRASGRNFCRECPPWRRTRFRDDTGHGTAVAGIVGATTSYSLEQGLRTAGTNWSVRLMPLKFLQESNLGRPHDAADAICHAADHGADIILAAWGGFGCDSTDLKNAVAHAEKKGVLFITAAGNDGLDLDVEAKKFYPAYYESSLDNVLVVGATDRDDNRERYSNFGRNTVHIGAPGVRTPVLGLERPRSVWPAAGTSVASAYVAGAAALVLAELIDQGIPDRSYLKVKQCLLHSAAARDKDLPWESKGRLDAYQAVKQIVDQCPAPP